MNRNVFFMLAAALSLNLTSITAQIQTGVFRTPAGNTDYHHFTRKSSSSAVFINQEGTGPILRLSSGTATANDSIKFSFEKNGKLGLGTENPSEKLSLYSAGNTKVVTQYGNGTGSGYMVGMDENGNGTVWHSAGKSISFGTSNSERMRINSNGYIDLFSPSNQLPEVIG